MKLAVAYQRVMGTKNQIIGATNYGREVVPKLRPRRRAIGIGGITEADDIRMGALLSGLAAAIALICASQIDVRIYDSFNIYFQADPPRVISNMLERTSKWQNATAAHPVFSIVSFSLIEFLAWFGIPKFVAAQGFVVAAAAGTTMLLFLAIRGIGVARLAAAGYVAVFLSSAAFLHWYAFLETFCFAGLSIAAMLCVLARADARSWWPWVLGSAFTLGITVTNWSLALLAGVARLSRRQFFLTMGGGFLLVLLLAVIQRKFFHGAFIFLFHSDGLARAARYNAHTMQNLGMPWSPWTSAQMAVTSGGVAPQPYVEVAQTDFGPWTIVNNQHSAIAEMSTWGLIALGTWLFLLGLGCWGVFRAGAKRRIGLAILAFCLGQVAFHTFYGEVTFLYVANYTPALVALMAFGWFTPWRTAGMVATAAFVLSGGINNYRQFQTAAVLAKQVAVDKAQGKAFGAF